MISSGLLQQSYVSPRQWDFEGAFDAQISATPPIPVNPVDQLYNPQAPRHLEDATSTADGPIPVVLSCEMAHAVACDGNGAGTRAVKIDCPFVGDLLRATNIMVTFSLISASNYDYPTHVHSVMYLFKSPTGYEDGEDPLAQVTISDVNSIQYNLRLQDVLPAVTVVCVISPGGPSYVNTLISTEYSATPDTTSHNLDGLSDDVPVDIPSNVHYGTSSNGVSINTDTYQPFSLDLTGTIDPAITTFAEITTSAGTATSQHGLKICCPTADPRSCWDAKHDDPIVIYSQPTAARSHEVTLQLLPNAVASVLVLINAIGLKAVGDFTIDAFLSVRTTLEIATVSPSPIPVPPAPTPLVLALAPPPNLPVPQPNATLQSADPISLSYLGGLDHPARLDTRRLF